MANFDAISTSGLHLGIPSLQRDQICPTGCCLIESFDLGLESYGWFFPKELIPEKVEALNTLHQLVIHNLPFSKEVREKKFLHPLHEPVRIVLIQRLSSYEGVSRQFCNPEGMVQTLKIHLRQASCNAEVDVQAMEGKSFQEQVELMRSASVVIGVDGAAMVSVHSVRRPNFSMSRHDYQAYALKYYCFASCRIKSYGCIRVQVLWYFLVNHP